MTELGKWQKLEILRIKKIGAFVGNAGDGDGAVLLPAKYLPEGAGVGDEIDVFIYRDSSDRLIATTKKPFIELGHTAKLCVKEVSRIGAFLDMGLERDLLLPFSKQKYPVKSGDICLVALYVDKSGRLAATMDVYSYMSADSPYKKDDLVRGTVYDVKKGLGAFVAVEDTYFGLVPESEIYSPVHPGDELPMRVVKVRDDGKLDLSLRQKAYLQMGDDAEKVMKRIEDCGGLLPFDDKASPELLKKEFGMSKNSFKRAVGRLLKEGRVSIADGKIHKLG